MFYDILDDNRKANLPLLRIFKGRFYLAGGTGLALQLGHRDSVDFDFFTGDHFDTAKLFVELLDIFTGRKIVRTLEEKDSLNVTVDGEIKLSFLRYPYVLIRDCLEEENFRIASVEDIACMKLSAIVSRAVEKDFVDLYFIIQKIPLKSLLTMLGQKMPSLDINLVLKSLVYFDDVSEEKIKFKHGSEVSLKELKNFLTEEVKRMHNLGR